MMHLRGGVSSQSRQGALSEFSVALGALGVASQPSRLRAVRRVALYVSLCFPLAAARVGRGEKWEDALGGGWRGDEEREIALRLPSDALDRALGGAPLSSLRLW